MNHVFPSNADSKPVSTKDSYHNSYEPDNTTLSTKNTFIEESYKKEVAFLVKQIRYTKDGFIDSEYDRIFDLGTEDERFVKANKYIRITCQNILYQTTVINPYQIPSKNKFEIQLIKKDSSGVKILKSYTRSNLDNTFNL